MDIKSNIKNKIRCSKCKGTGYMTQEPMVCKICNGKICMYCEFNGGFLIKPYDTCDKCNGYGEI